MGLALLFIACRKEEKTVQAAAEMQQFVIDLSGYAKNLDSTFIIVPQNGEALAYLQANPDLSLNTNYLNAIDGFGVEEIFYNGKKAIDTYRLDMLRELRTFKKIMVSEYVSDEGDLADAVQLNDAEGFICFPRSSGNYDYAYIPAVPMHENADPVNHLYQAKNYLYLISNSQFASKQGMIDAIAATNFDLVIIDLFFEDEPFTATEINQLKTKANGAIRPVLAYMSIGSAEKYRYYWQENWRLHKPDWLRKKYEGYKDEIWVEYWNPAWKEIIYGNDQSYLKRIIDADFDGVYLDNVEAYYFLYHRN